MQERHTNRERYFIEQGIVTEKYIIPYVETVFPITTNMVIGEIGCGEGGNLRPFLERGNKVIGIDLSVSKIENGLNFYANHPNIDNLRLIAEDIYDSEPDSIEKFDLIIMRDTIEHIPDQAVFLQRVREFLKPQGKIFFGYPPWCMPFGGHQQLCNNKFMSILPYYHLLPPFLYKGLLKIAGESKATIEGLMEVRDTRISINRFNKIIKAANFSFIRKDLYLVNPGYEIKFKLKTRKLPGFLHIPYLRDFIATSYYSVVQKED